MDPNGSRKFLIGMTHKGEGRYTRDRQNHKTVRIIRLSAHKGVSTQGRQNVSKRESADHP